ncbi:MAG: hypothetical protein BYD32DRAFT_459044 [Podila humilis]|nr:MAG: hypothetical protein BYD32DRAFT_459044 [Podila humilis]
MRLSVLRKILDATSSRLSALCLRLNYYRDDSAEYGEDHAWKSPGALFVNQVLPSIFNTLVRGVSAMPNLDRVILGNGQVSHFDVLYDDHQLAALISAGSKGWKQVQNDSTTQMGGFSMFALLQHFAVLEDLSNVQHIGGMGVITFLSVCPKLLLRIWVDGIPLDVDEDYPRKRQYLIKATFERLARLVNEPTAAGSRICTACARWHGLWSGTCMHGDDTLKRAVET